MLDYEFVGKLVTFLQALEKVETRAGFDLGLVVKDEDVKTKQILDLAPRAIFKKIDLIEINSRSYYEKILGKIESDLSKGISWIFLDLKEAYLPSQLYNRLRIGIPRGKSRIILIINKPDLEKIKIPAFLNLFGPVLAV